MPSLAAVATEPVRVGLVGAGPWATMVHAPVLAAGPETTLAGVWARRPDAAAELAGRHGAPAFADIDALVDASDAVAFCVPPDVQPELAAAVAARGRPLLLEKPVARDLAGARRLAAAVDAAGVTTQLVLSYRYADAVRAFLADAARFAAYGGRARFLSGALLGGPFATPWRLSDGALLDVGPHVLDLLDAALGRITGVRAHGDPLRWVGLLLEHEGGAVSEVSLCATTAIQPQLVDVELYGEPGVLTLDCVAAVGPAAFATLRRELAEMVRTGRPHPLDVHHGVHLQELLDAAATDLTRS